MSHFEAGRVRSKLMKWGKTNYQSYPWRGIDDPWIGMLSEILLQRTNVRHVLRYFDEITRLFPTPQAVLGASPAQLNLIENRFGLDRRLRTVIETAAYMDPRNGSPYDLDGLTSIYGIGHYTASAFLSLHAGVRSVIIDRNIARFLARLTGEAVPENIRHCHWVWDLAEELTPQRVFKQYNYAILDLTILLCKPRNPQCRKCPLEANCQFAQNARAPG